MSNITPTAMLLLLLAGGPAHCQPVDGGLPFEIFIDPDGDTHAYYELEVNALATVWVQYRWDSITRVVNRVAEAVHAHGKRLTAAVFPTPEIARTLVRQDWDHWNLDAVLPMIYHSFYNEDVAWIEAATREGVAALAGTAPLYAGLYIPALDPDALAEALP